jgi:dCMP deaminase
MRFFSGDQGEKDPLIRERFPLFGIGGAMPESGSFNSQPGRDPLKGEMRIPPGNVTGLFFTVPEQPSFMRTNRHQYFLDLALRCAHQGTCLRRNFGAIIVDEYNTIVSTGYTGAPRKQVDCTELKRCWRNDHHIPSGSNYEKCRSVHAEMNALLQAGKLARGCTLYLAGYEVETEDLTQIWPCFLCSKMIVNTGIRNVIMRTGETTYEETDPIVLYQKRSREALGE